MESESRLGSILNTSTLPVLQPILIADTVVSMVYGRGSHNRFAVSQVIHARSELMPHPRNAGASELCSAGMASETKDKRIVPRSSSTYELVQQKDFTLVIPPALTVCRQWPLAASHILIVPSVEAEAISLELCEKTAEYSSFRNQFDL
jgi:hypothetical protein